MTDEGKKRFHEDIKAGRVLETVCGFCKGRLFMAVYDRPEEYKDGYLVHSKPPCERFNTLEIDEFLAASRRAHGVHAPWDDEN